MDREMPRPRREQKIGADRANRYRQGLQSQQADEGEARGAGWRGSGSAANHKGAARTRPPGAVGAERYVDGEAGRCEEENARDLDWKIRRMMNK